MELLSAPAHFVPEKSKSTMPFSRSEIVTLHCLARSAGVVAGHLVIVGKNGLPMKAGKILCVFARLVMRFVLMKKIQMGNDLSPPVVSQRVAFLFRFSRKFISADLDDGKSGNRLAIINLTFTTRRLFKEGGVWA